MALDEIRNTKIEKVKKLRKAGIDPYPAISARTHSISDALKKFDEFSGTKEEIVLAGRIMAKREMGGAVFFDINDSAKIQVLIKGDAVGEEEFNKFREFIDIGDFVEVKGTLFLTKAGEKTLLAIGYWLLAKALLPLPEKWHGLQDTEERFRKRYLDLIMNLDEKELFVKKARFWQSIRGFLLREGGLEVETPVLEQVPGGADAEPFKTHMNALGVDLYLRISLELHLKRLIVAGFEKVFEIGRIFRNEGIDREHLQDYTQMEMYWAYYDYKKLMGLVENLFKDIIRKTLGTLKHEYRGKKINWDGQWQCYDYFSEFNKYTDLDLNEVSEKELKNYAEKEGINTSLHLGRGRLIDVIFKNKARSRLWEPGFLILPPVDIEPLAKQWPENQNKVERFQVMAGGTELGKGFSELNDPQEQMKRFEEQTKLREKGDKEAQRMDEDFIEALEYGMPPTAGFGMSERLFAFIVDRPVRETVFFPIMKPK
ncbi:MAG: lysine--tRNA ligase [Candidatus Yanofskybacteria bacterium RIFCSPHIGHO2_02_FULL_41_11]|uniref:Lysine--tRNA ligase n=1 Tax=Candidatus Yanofskybacteria bacterium RIFCSPHIGHO2_02_FULL_41_11 TaxID=1802675 RepID=A0A1F8F6X2_9BACT|nr:MAG: lysine--tRNA ligase [Candidatus Yanofskybacteria bacterium RIFCSPHIGHO2_02_FULL_41_11]